MLPTSSLCRIIAGLFLLGVHHRLPTLEESAHKMACPKSVKRYILREIFVILIPKDNLAKKGSLLRIEPWMTWIT